MSPAERPTIRSLRVTARAHRELSSLANALTGMADRRVTLSGALLAACAVARANLDATVAELPEGESDVTGT